MDFAEEMAALRQQAAKMPSEMRDIMLNATRELVQSCPAAKALKVGDKVPDFTLPNHKGEQKKFNDYLKQGPLVISFYRGGWCPYCNLELRALQEKLPEVTNLGASMVAISPELPDNSLSTAEKNALGFDVLSDLGNRVAAQFGLVFTLSEDLQSVYRKLGLDLQKSNGDDSMTLPIPATYVIDTDGTVLQAFVDPDYTTRLAPAEIIATLKSKQGQRQ